MTDSLLWVEGHRPRTINDCILSNKIKNTLSDVVKEEKIPNLMFTGPSGVGKTTAARAICEQTSNVGEQKGPVKREVVRVLTPGTLTDDSMLEEDRDNIIAAYCVENNDFCLVYAELSSGRISFAIFPLIVPLSIISTISAKYLGCNANSEKGILLVFV